MTHSHMCDSHGTQMWMNHVTMSVTEWHDSFTCVCHESHIYACHMHMCEWHMYDAHGTHMWMSNVTMSVMPHICDTHICDSHGTHMWMMSQLWMHLVVHAYAWCMHICEWVMSRGTHTRVSHVTWHTYVKESCHMAHICDSVMSHGTHMWMSHITTMNESSSTCICVCTYIYIYKNIYMHVWI